MKAEDLYDIAVMRAWDTLYDIADCLTPDEWALMFETFTTGYMNGAVDIFNARIKKEGY